MAKVLTGLVEYEDMVKIISKFRSLKIGKSKKILIVLNTNTIDEYNSLYFDKCETFKAK